MSEDDGTGGRGDDAAVVDELRELEVRRCRAITQLDLTTLGELLDAPLTHTHVDGRTEDRDTYLAAIGGRPRTTTPGEMAVRVLGDTAVMTGTLHNSGTSPAGVPMSGDIHALRVWRRSGGSWLLTAFAASGIPGGGR